MKLQLKEPFELEYNDDIYTGTLQNVTRKQTKILEKKHKKDDLEDDAIFKARLEMSLDSDDKDKIMAIGEEYNYKIIFETILRDIEERSIKK